MSTSQRYEVAGRGMWERLGAPGRIYERHPAATGVLDGGRRRVGTLGDGGGVPATNLEQVVRHHTYRVGESPPRLDDLGGTPGVRNEGEGACVVVGQRNVQAVAAATRLGRDVATAAALRLLTSGQGVPGPREPALRLPDDGCVGVILFQRNAPGSGRCLPPAPDDEALG